jgi:hypothetical protein
MILNLADTSTDAIVRRTIAEDAVDVGPASGLLMARRTVYSECGRI